MQLWHVDASNGQVIADGVSPNFSFTPNDNGVFTVSFTATDDDGATSRDEAVITVNNAAPTLTLSPGSTFETSQSVIVSGPLTDPGKDGWHVFVEFGDGALEAVSVRPDLSFVATHIYSQPGIFTPVVTVIDDDLGKATGQQL